MSIGVDIAHAFLAVLGDESTDFIFQAADSVRAAIAGLFGFQELIQRLGKSDSDGRFAEVFHVKTDGRQEWPARKLMERKLSFCDLLFA